MVARCRGRCGRCSRCSWHGRRLHTEGERYTAGTMPPQAAAARAATRNWLRRRRHRRRLLRKLGAAPVSPLRLSPHESLSVLSLSSCRRSLRHPVAMRLPFQWWGPALREWSRGHPLVLSPSAATSLSFFAWDREAGPRRLFLDFSFDTLSCEESPGLRPVRRGPSR